MKLPNLSRWQWLQVVIILPSTIILVPLCLIAGITLGVGFVIADNGVPLFLNIIAGVVMSGFFLIPVLGILGLWFAVLKRPEEWLKKPKLFVFLSIFGFFAILISIFFLSNQYGDLTLASLLFQLLILAPTVLGCVKLYQYFKLKYFT